jgi:hypothetical protein
MKLNKQTNKQTKPNKPNKPHHRINEVDPVCCDKILLVVLEARVFEGFGGIHRLTQRLPS